MDEKMAIIILFSMLFLMAFSCEKKVIDQEPEEGAYIGDYTNILGKVITNDTYEDIYGDTCHNWAIDISKRAFNSIEWTIDSSLYHHSLSSDSILAPGVSLPDLFKVNNIRIIFSAERYYTWGELTQPDFRGVYGWKVILTKIEQYQE